MARKMLNDAILQSSIWNEPYQTRIVYMTLQFLKDEHDMVNCDFEALQRIANVTNVELTNSLNHLQSIYVYSTDISFSGQLVSKTTNGYKVLDIYNDNMKSFREKRKHYMRDYRATKKAESEGIKIPDRPEQYQQKGVTTKTNKLNIKK